MIEAIEIVSFQLVQGTSFSAFVDANREIDAWLLLQPGFRSRRIAQQAGSHVVDLLVWDSEEVASTAMHKLMDELRDSPVHALIDQETVTWSLAAVRHKHGRDR